MSQCAKLKVGLMANFGKVFYQTFTNVFLFFPRFYVFWRFLIFYLNVYYIYGLGRVCRQWVAVPFAANHEALKGRNIFSNVQPLPSSTENSSTVTASVVPAVESVTSSNHTGQETDVSWLGTFNPAHTGYWIDSALLLVFGGIPWQVCIIRFPIKYLSAAWATPKFWISDVLLMNYFSRFWK